MAGMSLKKDHSLKSLLGLEGLEAFMKILKK